MIICILTLTISMLLTYAYLVLTFGLFFMGAVVCVSADFLLWFSFPYGVYNFYCELIFIGILLLLLLFW